MDPPVEPSQTCSRCELRPATVRYTHATTKVMISEMVCATCLDRLEVQDAYERKCIEIIDPLESNEQYDEALADLEAFLEANRHRDHEQWLARNIARDRAQILFDARRYAEAEQACKAWAELRFSDPWGRWLHDAVSAKTLDALGRPQEGVAVLEDGLIHRDPKHMPTARTYLEKLAELSEKRGKPVDPKWRSLAEEVAAWHGVEMPEHVSLGRAILELSDAIDKAERMRRGEPEDDEDDEDEP